MINSTFIYSQTYTDKRGKLNHGCGFGDYIRGSLALYQVAKELNIGFKMDLSNHSIGQYLLGHETPTGNKPDELFRNFNLYQKYNLKKYINRYFWRITQNQKHINHQYNTLCNSFPDHPLSEDCKEFVRSAMMPNAELETIIAQYKPKKDYVAIHIRTGDLIGFSGNDNATEELVKKIAPQIKEIKAQSKGKKIYVFSDSMKLKILLKKQYKTCYTETMPSHSMKTDCNIVDMLVDWFCIQYSSHVYQFTNDYHGWGSGFSDSASWLRDVPITKYKF
jgi:hypothetical protein